MGASNYLYTFYTQCQVLKQKCLPKLIGRQHLTKIKLKKKKTVEIDLQVVLVFYGYMDVVTNYHKFSDSVNLGTIILEVRSLK